MPTNSNFVKKQTILIAVALAFGVGFFSGIIYSVYKSPADDHNHAPAAENSASATITALELETQTNPDNDQAWVQLGHAYFDSEQFQKAITAYNKSLELLPGDTNVMTDLGVMYRRNGQPEIAIATFDKVLELDPGHEQARFNKGVVLLNDLNDKEGTIAEWKKLVEQNPFAAAPSGTLLSEIIDQISQDGPVKNGDK